LSEGNYAASSDVDCLPQNRVIGQAQIVPLFCYQPNSLSRIYKSKDDKDQCGTGLRTLFGQKPKCMDQSSTRLNSLVETLASNSEIETLYFVGIPSGSMQTPLGMYTGYIVNGLPYKMGKLTYDRSLQGWNLEDIYIGEFENGIPNGFGQIYYVQPKQKEDCTNFYYVYDNKDIDENEDESEDEDEIEEDEEMRGGGSLDQKYLYIGYVMNGKPNGYGILQYPTPICDLILTDGIKYNIYRGSFENGFMHGMGKLEYGSSLMTYIGRFEYNKPIGKGHIEQANGSLINYDPSYYHSNQRPMDVNDPLHLEQLLINHHKYVYKLPNHEVAAIGQYTGSAYDRMNQAGSVLYKNLTSNVRARVDPRTEKLVRDLYKVISKAPPTLQPLIVY
jgi:hypothetical protein